MQEEGIVVLSLFDGISCGRVALERAGIKVKAYYASEIDKHAIKVSQDNWKDIIHIGDVTKVSFKDGVLKTEIGEYEVGKVDLVLAGSPCQGFSMAGKQLAFDDPRSSLYFVFERVLAEIKQENPDVKFLLENVKMKKEHKDVITERLGVEPIIINSNLVSAQNRYRLYWTNISSYIEQPEDKGILLKDIVQEQVDEKYYINGGRLKWLNAFGEVKVKNGRIVFNPPVETSGAVHPARECGRRFADGIRDDNNKGAPIQRFIGVSANDKSHCVTTVQKDTLILQWPHGTNSGGYRAIDGKTPAMTTSSWESNNYLLSEGMVRKLTPEECEVLQTLPVGYTKSVADSHRYKALGNGWTVDVIAHIMGYME